MGEPCAPPDIVRLVGEHHEAVYRYAYRLCGAAADAEDLTQQVFLTAQTKLDQLRNPQSARAWLFTVLRNCYLKSRRRRVPMAAADAQVNVDEIPAELPEESFDSEQLQAALDSLDDDFKVVLLLFYFEDCSYREIADRLELPMGTVMSRLSRAKGHLRAKLLEPAPHAAPDGQRMT
mgnify:CR=1 FL=1